MKKQLIREKENRLFELLRKLDLLADDKKELEKTLKEIDRTQNELEWLKRGTNDRKD